MLLEPLSFSRDAIAAGEVWRLLTAAFAHLSWSHLTANLSALAVLVMLLRPYAGAAQILGVLAVCALAATLGLYFGSSLTWYVGASGSLYGLLAWGTTRLPMPGGLLLMLLVIAGTLLDQGRTVSSLGEPLAPASHLWGVVGGLGVALTTAACQRLRAPRAARINST